ncbi:hypothetical protein C8Q80DRAFT_509533 [Daedaleopsis nitida]|nr:hypothetical protein C8Q80DRAFT_509533 [Daedaleopsis nitida]
MILPENTPDTPSKTVRTGPPSDSDSISSLAIDEHLSPPPAYPGPAGSHGSYGGSAPIQCLHPQHGDVEAQTCRVHPSESNAASSAKRASTSMRVLKAFGILVLVLILLGSFARTVVTVARRRDYYDHELEEISLIPFPVASDGAVEECVSLSSFAAAETVDTRPMVTFDLSSTTSVLYVFGRGSLARGAFTLTSSNDPSIPKDTIRVDITPHYASPLALEKPNFCLLARAPGEKSIGILTSENWSLNRDLTLSIHIRLPVFKGHGALHVKTFQEDLFLFSHAPSPSSGAPMTWHSWVRLYQYMRPSLRPTYTHSQNPGHYQIPHPSSGHYQIPVPTGVSSVTGTWHPYARPSSMYSAWRHSEATGTPIPTYTPKDVSPSS